MPRDVSRSTAESSGARPLSATFPRSPGWTPHLPDLELPRRMKGHFGHLVAVCGMDDDSQLGRRSCGAARFASRHENFADARARIGSYKNRLLLVEPSDRRRSSFPARSWPACEAVSSTCHSPRTSFSLPAIRKWGKMMTDTEERQRLAGALQGRVRTVRHADFALRGRQAGELTTRRAPWTVCRFP